MIKGKKKTELTMDTILQKVTPFDIYYHFMPNKDWKLNSVTFSPFKLETHPSFLIGNKYGNLTHVAFNNTALRGDCFSFVKQLHNLATLDDVLSFIDNSMGLGIRGIKKDYEIVTSSYKQPEITKRNTYIQVITRKFTNEELEYWNEYHQNITDLRDNNIYSIKTLYFNKQKFPLKDTELRFGYFYDGFWKIYRPFGKKREKWMPNNVPITIMDGKDKIKDCDIAFINKSKKDHMVLSKVFPCSCAVQNEGIACFSPENLEYLKANSKRQILAFDSDTTGKNNSLQITKLFDFDYCNVPNEYQKYGIKDFADWAKFEGLGAIEKFLIKKGIIN